MVMHHVSFFFYFCYVQFSLSIQWDTRHVTEKQILKVDIKMNMHFLFNLHDYSTFTISLYS